jgi:uncharacterized membrane protein
MASGLLLVAAGLLAIAALGLLVSVYFTAVTYGWVRPDASWIPKVCRMDEDTCARIVDTRYGQAFGAPNSLFGIAWYLAVAGVTLYRLTGEALVPCSALILTAAAVVGFSVYLAWALVQKLEVHCPLCYLSHALNAGVLSGFVGLCALT